MAHQILSSIAYAAGKSGGHIIPCLTLMLQQPTIDPALFFTTRAPLDRQIIQTSKLPVRHIALPLDSSYTTWYKKLLMLVHLFVSFCKCVYLFIKYKPAKLVTTGGLVAVPPACAAYILGIPIELYELNALPGRSTRFLSHIAHAVFVCFDQAQMYFSAKNCKLAAYPLKYSEQEKQISKQEACDALQLQADKPVLLILGGSQGSVQLNALAKDIIAQYGSAIQIIHQTGATDSCDWKAWYDAHQVPAHVFAYCADLTLYLAAADLIICRAGAGTLFELMYFGKKCIIIPLEGVADEHQLSNAYAIQKQYSDLCTVIRYSHADPKQSVHEIMQQIDDSIT